jgi:hypothetical protein
LALTQELVDEFIAAAKVVPKPRSMTWRRDGTDLLRWDALVESEAVIRGRLWLDFNQAIGKYGFNLQLEGTPVYGWHFRPAGRHRQPACPESFPRNVGYPHEQFWIEGVGYRCARLLEGLEGLTHEEHFIRFCERANIEFTPTYAAPIVAEQTVLHFGEDTGER